MKLVIAEKPSVANSISKVIGADKHGDGYLMGNGYIVSWCIGHLAGLAVCETYNANLAKWRYEDLPIIPSEWQYEISKDKEKQFEVLKKLLNQSDVTEVINACDAGREGELIFRTVYNLAGCTKPMQRLWISSMEDGAIRDGFNNLHSGSEYDNLYKSAVCRSKADWLVGINATRLFSVLYHRTLNIGRVVSPTLALIVHREAEIMSFKSEPFYKVELEIDGVNAEGKRIADKAEAESLAKKCEAYTAVVKSVESKEKSEKAPLLYDLTTLQRDANRILGYTSQQTLDFLQSLYEKKLCTYPRTDSRYLTDDMIDTVESIVSYAANIIRADIPNIIISEQVCSSKKVSDHHAIILTESAYKADKMSLKEEECELLELIALQVLRAVGEPYKYLETTAVIACGDELFTAKGKSILNYGWKVYNKNSVQDNVLPEMSTGKKFSDKKISISEGMTKPPLRFTEDTLLSSMENAGVKDTPVEAERKGLGTPATRASIIEKLVATDFVERKKNKKTTNLVPANIGISLIAILPEQLQSSLLTAQWERQLIEIEHGKLDGDEFMDSIQSMVEKLVKEYKVVDGAEELFPSGRARVGKCPRCGSDVTESKRGFFCERNDCKFGIWRDSRYFITKKVNVTKKMAETLLNDGKIFIKGMYSGNTKKTYDAFVVMTDDGNKTSYNLEFMNKK